MSLPHSLKKETASTKAQVTLESGGTWKITVAATKNGAALATKQLSLQAEGGM